MDGLKELLLKEQKHLEQILRNVAMRSSDAPEGHLRISMDKGKTRYYHCDGDRNGKYISKKDLGLAKALAEKTYLESVSKRAEYRLKQINRVLLGYSDGEIDKLYEELHEERKSLVTPVEPTFSQEVEHWLQEPFTKKPFQEGTMVILSNRGERVRSKSEKILADYFDSAGIPYLYEKPLALQGYGIIYPDFTFYSKRLRKEIYWEHEGMMDNPEYARTAVKKINGYIANGIYPGERLILTYETELDVLSTKTMRVLVNKYLP